MTSEMFGFAREAADWNFPLVDERISQLQELLEIGLRLNAYKPGDEELPAEAREAAEDAAERTAEEIIDALIYGVPPKLAAFLSAGQSSETTAQIYEWMALVTGPLDPVAEAAKAALRETRQEATARPLLAIVKGAEGTMADQAVTPEGFTVTDDAQVETREKTSR
jgi:hypothetical protein